MKTIKQADLTFQEGTSNKEYHAQVVQVAKDNYVVNFQYGRIGNTLQTGTKTPTAVSLTEANDVFDDLVASKEKKGYVRQ